MLFFFFPLPKVPCNATTTCNGHGSCTNDGDCKCDNSFYAADCSGKLSLHYHQNTFCNLKCFVLLVECDAGQKCSGQGICGPDGACECDMGFYMEDCSSKLKIWYCFLILFCEKNCDQEKLL